MKASKIKFSLLSILMPLTIILGVGGYFASISWIDYMNDLNLQQDIDKIEALKSLEDNLYKEIICTSKMSAEVDNLKDECKDIRTNTDSIIVGLSDKFSSETISQKINSFFSTSDNNSSEEKKESLKEDINDEKNIFQEDNLKNIIEDIRYSMDTVEDIKLVMLLDGEYYKQIIEPIHTYFSKLDTHINKDNKEYMDFLNHINILKNNSMIETVFGSYFLSTRKSFTSHELASWDKYMSLSVMPEEKLYITLDDIKNEIKDLFETESTYDLIDKLDKMRIDILLGNSIGEYNVAIDSWILINSKKQNMLSSAWDITFSYLSKKSKENLTKHEIILFSSLLIILISLIIFVFTVKKSLNRIKDEEEALRVMLNEIDILTAKSKKEVFSNTENVLQDFSDKKQIYAYISSILKLLHEKELQAEDASTAKDLFLANMSHEIRTPLNGIVGFTQLLKESSLTPDQQEFITIIENSSDNLLAIVSDILDLSKISANKMDLESISFDIFEKVESAVETFAAKADEKRIELGVFIDPDIPQYLVSDPTKLSQVLINLISNAIKFTPVDGTINLIAEYIEDNGDGSVTIRFAVKDSGIGVNEEQRTKIFQAFTQADSSTSREFGGTGLGLTISYTIIQYMGGELDVASAPGEGAEFFFTIKLKKDTSAEEMIYPKYEGLNIGLALPEKLTDRQVDENLKTYIETIKARFSIYSYDELLNGNQATILPDILFIDHSFAKKSQEINMFAKLKTHIILMTTGSLKRIIDVQDRNFLTIIHKPMTMSKTTRLVEEYSSGEVAVVENDSEKLETNQFQHINALVAEDNLINQKLILVTLEKFGVEVTLASNGQEAFEHRKHEVYDIIFMDIQMPVMNGMEATKAILEYEKEENLDHIPIIALTANALKGDREKYIEAGMDGYASKPLNLQEIKTIIGKYFSDDEESTSSTSSDDKIVDDEVIEDRDEYEDDSNEEYEEYEEYDEEDEITVEKECDILLYNEMSLQSQVYSRIFKGLGYDVEIVDDDDTFLDKIESGIYVYALYDLSCCDNSPCMVADIARDADTVPLVFVTEEPEGDFCADTLERNLDSSELKERLESAS